MRRTSTVLAGLTLAAGLFGGTAAFAMGDGYHYQRSTMYYYRPQSTYLSPGYYHSEYAPLGSYYGTYQYPEASSYSDWRYRRTYQHAPHSDGYTYQYAPHGGYDNDGMSYQRRGIGYDMYIGR
jgi:hypothetical protein